MNLRQSRKWNQFKRESGFMADNAADFPAGSPGGKTITRLNGVMAQIRDLNAGQVSGLDDRNKSRSLKNKALEDLRALMSQIILAAKGVAQEVPGVDKKFRWPRSNRLTEIIAAAESFLKDAAPHQALFNEYGLDDSFLEELERLIGEVTAHDASVDRAGSVRGQATGGLLALFKRGAELSRLLATHVRIRYRFDPAKLAAWKIASHLERAAKTTREPAASAG